MTTPAADLRLGAWQDTCTDVWCNVLLGDPPFSGRTHAGRRTGSELRQADISYSALTWELADEVAEFWHTRTRDFVVLFCDHVAYTWHEAAWSARGWYTFAPVPWCKTDAAPRFSGDGPASGTEWLMVARPRQVTNCGSLPPWYSGPSASSHASGRRYPGAKPLWLMRQLVRDYSKPQDLICDPFAGTGTTLVAALECGRRAVGSELDPKVHALATRRFAGVRQADLLFSTPSLKQDSLLLEV